MACYTFAQLEQFARNAGFDPVTATIMAAIAKAESGGCDVIQQGQPYGTTGWGLWQITPGNSESGIGTDSQLLDPTLNAKAAYQKYSDAHGLSPWTTFTSGAYLSYLPGGSLFEAGARNDSGSGSAPTGSGGVGSGRLEGQTGGSSFCSVPVIGGAVCYPLQAGSAVVSTVVGWPGQALNSIGSGISGGLVSAGEHLLPWLIILGVGAFALFMIGHELSSKSGSGGGMAGAAMAQGGGKTSAVEEAAAAA